MPRPKLLLIDDHPQVLQYRKERLESFGYAVVTATTVPSAMAILEHTAIAAVLVEYKFEGIDAEAVACRIKGRFPAQLIILLSAYSAVPERILWLVDEYVMRSDPMEALVRTIERLTHPKAHKPPAVRKNLTTPGQSAA
jgi:CheY-like chemotaxis protein